MLGRKGPAPGELLTLFSLFALVLSFNYEMIFTDQVPFFRDLGPYFYPMRFTLAGSFKRGELPLWDRHTGMGFPLMADFQSGAFYLPHLLFLMLPFFTAIRAIFLFHYLVAAAGSYCLLRRWGHPRYLAVIGSILFTLGGTVVSLTNLLNHFQSAVWLPWALLFWEKALSSGSRKSFLSLVFVLWLQLLAGSPEIYLISSLLLLLDALRVASERERPSSLGIVGLFAAANLLAAGLAMAQILPTVEIFLESRGYRTIHYSESTLWSLHPLSLFNLFFIDKEVDPSLLSGIHLFFVREIPFFITHYLGLAALVGICLWFQSRAWKEKILLVGVITAFLLLAMGRYTPVYPILFQYIPLVRFFRFPEKFFYLVQALLLFMALRGLYEFLERCPAPGRKSWIILGSIAGAVAGTYLYLRMEMAPLIRLIAWATGAPPDVTLRSSAGVLFYLERQMFVIFGLCLVLVLGKTGKLKPALFQILLVLLVFVDLAVVHRPYRFLLDPAFVSADSKILPAPDGEPDRLFYYPGPANLHPSYYTLSKAATFSRFNRVLFNNLLPNTGAFYGFDYMQELDALMMWPYRLFLGVSPGLPLDGLYRLLGALNVKYLVSLQPMPTGALSLVRHFPEYPSWLYELKRVVPRAYIVGEVVSERDFFKTLGWLSSRQFDPMREVVLAETIPLRRDKEFKARAEIVRYRNQEVTIRAALDGAGVLVLADSYYPGWRAYVDGEEKEILRANLFFRAVPLSAGEHVVEFRYRPRSFTIGLAISLTTLCGVAAAGLICLFRRKDGSTPWMRLWRRLP